MKEYAIVIATTLILAWMIPHTYLVSVYSFETRTKDRLCYFLIFAILTCFIGLRTDYNDTAAYIGGYQEADAFPKALESFSVSLAYHPGFVLVKAWLKTLDVSVHGFLLLFAGFSVACALLFFKRYSSSFTLSLFLYFATNYYTFTAAAVKQTTATAIALIAVFFALKRKWFPFVVLICIASTFHTYVILYALVPFLTFKPWTKPTYVMLISFIIIGFMLESLFGTIIDITSMLGDTYIEAKLIGEGINIFRVIVANAPTILSFLYRKELFRDSNKTENVIVNLSMLNGAIMFVGQFGKAIYFSRLASYFTIMQCVALPWIIYKLPIDRRKLYYPAMVIGYFGFFAYANILGHFFENNFSRITLIQYLSKVF